MTYLISWKKIKYGRCFLITSYVAGFFDTRNRLLKKPATYDGACHPLTAREGKPVKRYALFREKIRAILWKYTGDAVKRYGQSCENIRATPWKDTGDAVKRYGRPHEKIRAIPWKDTGDPVKRYGRSCEKIRAIPWKDTGDLYNKEGVFSLEKKLPKSIKWKRTSCQNG